MIGIHFTLHGLGMFERFCFCLKINSISLDLLAYLLTARFRCSELSATAETCTMMDSKQKQNNILLTWTLN